MSETPTPIGPVDIRTPEVPERRQSERRGYGTDDESVMDEQRTGTDRRAPERPAEDGDAREQWPNLVPSQHMVAVLEDVARQLEEYHKSLSSEQIVDADVPRFRANVPDGLGMTAEAGLRYIAARLRATPAQPTGGRCGWCGRWEHEAAEGERCDEASWVTQENQPHQFVPAAQPTGESGDELLAVFNRMVSDLNHGDLYSGRERDVWCLIRARLSGPSGWDTHDWPQGLNDKPRPLPCMACGIFSDDPGAEEPCRLSQSGAEGVTKEATSDG